MDDQTRIMDEQLHTLETAISDTGHWRYWQQVEGILQLEFGWVKLHLPRQGGGYPLSNILAIRFDDVRSLAIMEQNRSDDHYPPDWFEQLPKKGISPVPLDEDYFNLSDSNTYYIHWSMSTSLRHLIGDEDSMLETPEYPGFLSFWSGSIGLLISAGSMRLFDYNGEFPLEEVPERRQRWWDYWRGYWDAKRAGTPLPYDRLCEVHIPMRGPTPES